MCKLVNVNTGEEIDVDYAELNRRKRLKRRIGIVQAAEHYNLNCFITLTINRLNLPEDVCPVCVLHYCWSVYLKRLRRAIGRISFVSVTEVAKFGFYHMHILTNADLSHPIFAEAWQEISRGGNFWCEVIPDAEVKKWLTTSVKA
ncbi:MAG: hypothetical protein Kow0042_24540 [Calditrichia bacterium]